MKKKQIIIVTIAVVLILGALVWIAQRFGIGQEKKRLPQCRKFRSRRWKEKPSPKK